MKIDYDFTKDVNIEICINGNLLIKDFNNNCIYFKDSDGHEYWKKYDTNNNKIHYKDSDGYEYWQEYDENNNKIHYKESNGYEVWTKYDNNNNLIHSKDSNGHQKWFDNNGDKITEKEYDSIHNSYNGKTVTIDGKEYTLTPKDKS